MTDNTAQPVVTTQPPIDHDKLVNEAAEKAAILAAERAKVDEESIVARAKQEIIDRIVDKPVISEDAPAWEKRGEEKPSSWEELLSEAETRIEKKQTKKQEREAEEARKAAEKEAREKERSTEEWSKIWDGQLDDLEKAGRLPKMADEIKDKINKKIALTDEEKEDPGLQARYALQRVALEKKESNLKVAYYEHFQNSDAATSAMTSAPVFGSRKASRDTNKTEFSYEEIRNSSYDDLLA